MALELDSLQLYEKLNYKYKKFKKSDLQNYLFFILIIKFILTTMFI